MKSRFKHLSAFVLLSGLLAGCSSSNNSPGFSPSIAPDANSVDADAGVSTFDLNGDYDIVVSLSEASMAIPECTPVSGTMTVTGTMITGLVDDRFSVTGSIASNGAITGGFALEDGNAFANYNGGLDGEALAGTWSDVVGCAGSWRAEKVQ